MSAKVTSCQTSQISRFVIVSTIAHALVYQLFCHVAPQFNLGRRASSTAFKVTLVEQFPARPGPEGVTNQERSYRSATRSKASSPPPHALNGERGSSTPIKPNYHDLFPDNHTIANSIADSTNEGALESPRGIADPADIARHDSTTKLATGRKFGLQGKRLTPTQDLWMDEIASKMLLPLEWRKFATTAHATAVIRREGQGKLWLDSLYGDPMVRAILYQNLVKPETSAELLRVLQNLNTSEFKIVLRFVKQTEHVRGLNSQISAFKDGLVITKEMPQATHQLAGIPIEDEYTRRAKLRENIEIRKLMDLAAYQRRLDHVLLLQ